MTKTKTITWDELWDKYKPIKNHLDDNASLNGDMFETFGEELDHVRLQKTGHIWTYVDSDDDETFVITSGYHFVNRIGYLITEVSHDDEIIDAVDD